MVPLREKIECQNTYRSEKRELGMILSPSRTVSFFFFFATRLYVCVILFCGLGALRVSIFFYDVYF